MKTRLAGIIAFLFLVAAAFWFLKKPAAEQTAASPPASVAESSPRIPPPGPEVAPVSPAAMASSSGQAQPATAAVSPASSSTPAARPPQTLEDSIQKLATRPFDVKDSGLNRSFELAMDEVFSPQAGALQSVSSTGGSMLQAIREAGIDVSSTQPVLYEAGRPRSESTRRIVTKKILVHARDRAEADKLAEPYGLAFKNAPTYSPGKFVFEADSAWGVLGLLAGLGDVAKSSLHPLLATKLHPRSAPNDPLFPNHWHLRFANQAGAVATSSANVSSLWGYSGGASLRGQGILVGIVDDGVDVLHPDLAPNMNPLLGFDWVDGDDNPVPGPGDSHGTAVAGNVAARGNNSIGAVGSAPEATLVALRLSGATTDDSTAEAMSHLPDIIHIKNNSWGPSDDGLTLAGPGDLTADALEAVATNGRGGRGGIFTWAGGNGLQNQDYANFDGFANSIHVIAVGASDSRARQAAYSESGANLAVCAPSSGDSTVLGISTTDLRGSKGYNNGQSGQDYQNFTDYTKLFGGTSSATPTVSGIIALMLQANPALGPRDVKEILMTTASRIQLGDAVLEPDEDFEIVAKEGWIENSGGLFFNHKFGAGLVDASAAVATARTWKNLAPPVTASVTENSTVAIPDNTPVWTTKTLTINATDLRVEHVTLGVRITDVPKGDLWITLTSPSGTESVFCRPHWDGFNEFEDWTFMTVRCWGEDAAGDWIVRVADVALSEQSGNWTETTLTVHGSSTVGTNPPPFVEIVSPNPGAALRSAVTFTANATDFNADGTPGTISSVEFYVNGTLVNTDSVSPYTFSWNAGTSRPGDYVVVARAQDAEGLVVESPPITFNLLPNTLVAGWDFETLSANQSTIQLPTALQSMRQYAANFGSNNGTVAKMLVDGTNESSRWDVSNGEIWTGTGSAINAGESFSTAVNTSSGLMLRAGKNLSANGNFIVFQINMAGARRLNVSYATFAAANGFNRHEWAVSTDGQNWTDTEERGIVLTPGEYQKIALEEIGLLNNSQTALLRLTVSGATADSGFNILDNLVFSATK